MYILHVVKVKDSNVLGLGVEKKSVPASVRVISSMLLLNVDCVCICCTNLLTCHSVEVLYGM